MSEICHLSRAPIVEAIINFQANAARLWKPAGIRELLSARWPDHAEIQELRPVQIQVTQTAEGPLPPTITSQVEGYIFRSPKALTAHHVRRDGYAFIKFAPYQDWNSLQAFAIAGWADYRSQLEPEELHAVGVRFVNQLDFPAEDFHLSRYFTNPPAPPPHLGWGFHGFMNQSLYGVPNSPCAVTVIFTRGFMTQEVISFVIDIQVSLKEPLAATGKSMEVVLEEMHNLKNKAFFNLLTEEALGVYK